MSDLKRAVNNAMTEIRRMPDRGACPTCDPGGEGSEVWGEIVDSLELALKSDGVASDGARTENKTTDDENMRSICIYVDEHGAVGASAWLGRPFVDKQDDPKIGEIIGAKMSHGGFLLQVRIDDDKVWQRMMDKMKKPLDIPISR